MSRPRNLKLEKLDNHEAQPHISIVGHGKNTFLWVGDKRCYSYTHGANPRELYKFAEALMKRLMQPYKQKQTKGTKPSLSSLPSVQNR